MSTCIFAGPSASNVGKAIVVCRVSEITRRIICAERCHESSNAAVGWHSGTGNTVHSSHPSSITHLSAVVARPLAPPHVQPRSLSTLEPDDRSRRPLCPSMPPVAFVLPSPSCRRHGAAGLMVVLRLRRLSRNSRSPHRLPHIRRSPVPTLPPSLARLLPDHQRRTRRPSSSSSSSSSIISQFKSSHQVKDPAGIRVG